MTTNSRLGWCLLLAVAGACGGKEEACVVADQTGCDSGEVCEVVSGTEETLCARPVVVAGRVFDLTAAGQPAISGARVVAVDGNGAPASAVSVSDVNGAFSVTVPVERDADGAPLPTKVTLRADASHFLAFPAGIRQAIPIELSTAVSEDARWLVSSSLTEVGLIALPGGAPSGVIRGVAAVPEGRTGVLVVAESGGKGYSVIADVDGDYAIYNLPAGAYVVSGYAAGMVHTPVSLTLAAAGTATADLVVDGTRTPSAVAGSVNFVNPGSGLTSVVLVVESTFDDLLKRGQVPPGLRAPGPGIVANVTGPWRIEGVPPGRYVALAGFENDGYVRDPDTGIGGTAIVHIEVGSAQDMTLTQSFKVTGAIQLFGPGPEGPVTLASRPTLEWANDSSAKSYQVTVIDALGTVTLDQNVIDGSGDRQSIPYTGAFTPGVFYQVRVVSLDGDGTPLSSTEDLRGVFQAEVL